MDTAIAILGLILVFIVVPALIGCIWVILFGVPVWGMMKAWELAMVYMVNPIFIGINKIPILGRVITTLAAAVIALATSAIVIGLVEFPIVALILLAMNK